MTDPGADGRPSLVVKEVFTGSLCGFRVSLFAQCDLGWHSKEHQSVSSLEPLSDLSQEVSSRTLSSAMCYLLLLQHAALI